MAEKFTRHFSSIEKVVLLLSLVFFLFGLCLMLHPAEIRVAHPGTAAPLPIGPDPPDEVVSPKMARVYGVVCIALGGGLGWLVFYRPHK